MGVTRSSGGDAFRAGCSTASPGAKAAFTRRPRNGCSPWDTDGARCAVSGTSIVPRTSSASDRSAFLQHGRQPFGDDAVTARVGMDRVRLQVLVLTQVTAPRRIVRP